MKTLLVIYIVLIFLSSCMWHASESNYLSETSELNGDWQFQKSFKKGAVGVFCLGTNDSKINFNNEEVTMSDSLGEIVYKSKLDIEQLDHNGYKVVHFRSGDIHCSYLYSIYGDTLELNPYNFYVLHQDKLDLEEILPGIIYTRL